MLLGCDFPYDELQFFAQSDFRYEGFLQEAYYFHRACPWERSNAIFETSHMLSYFVVPNKKFRRKVSSLWPRLLNAENSDLFSLTTFMNL